MTVGKKVSTHVIFDFDGLLVDTECLYTKAIQEVVGKYGKVFTPQMKAGMMGRKRPDGGAFLLNAAGLTDKLSVDEFWKRTTAIVDQLFEQVDACPGAEQLVRHFISSQIPTALCTGSSLSEYTLKAKRHVDWLDLITLKVYGDDPFIKHCKPHPDPFLATISRFPSQPSHPSSVIVFEDSPNGVQSALAAGCRVIWVPDPKTPIDENLRSQVDGFLTSLHEFSPEEFGFPQLSR